MADKLELPQVHGRQACRRHQGNHGKVGRTGMQTFDRHLYRLYLEGRISLAEALRNADSPSKLKLKINLSGNLNKPRLTTSAQKK